MERKELSLLLTRISAAGAAKALALCGNQPNSVSKSQAYRLYGRSIVDRWLREGLIHFTNKHVERAKLKQVAAASNRITYLPVAER